MTYPLTDVERISYTVEEAAAAIGIGRSLAYELIQDGTIPSVLLGRRRVIPRRLLEEWLENEANASQLAQPQGMVHDPRAEGAV